MAMKIYPTQPEQSPINEHDPNVYIGLSRAAFFELFDIEATSSRTAQGPLLVNKEVLFDNTDEVSRDTILFSAELKEPLVVMPGDSHDVFTPTNVKLPEGEDSRYAYCAEVLGLGGGFDPMAIVIDSGFDASNGFVAHLRNGTEEPITINDGDYFAAVKVSRVYNPGDFNVLDASEIINFAASEAQSPVSVALSEQAKSRGLNLDRLTNPNSEERHDGDAGFDLQLNSNERIVLRPDSSTTLATGVIISADMQPRVQPRTGLGRKGIIPKSVSFGQDGEVLVHVFNEGRNTIEIEPGQRFSQLLFDAPQKPVNIIGAADPATIPESHSSRKDSAYGSTGK